MNHYYKYNQEIVRELFLEKTGQLISNKLPIKSITIHLMSKETVSNSKYINIILLVLEKITGQRAKGIQAKESIANWKLKKESWIGGKVILHHHKMYYFLDQFIQIIRPKISQLSHQITLNNYNIGISDLLIFPQLEEEYSKFDKLKGIDINIQFEFLTPKEIQMWLNLLELNYE